MAAHKWEMTAEWRHDSVRSYSCTRCGKGPILKNVFDSKNGFLAAAKKAGISADCNLEICKNIHEEDED